MCAGEKNTYGELGVHLVKGVAGYAIGDLELRIVLNRKNPSLDLAVYVGGRKREGGGKEREENCCFEIHDDGVDGGQVDYYMLWNRK